DEKSQKLPERDETLFSSRSNGLLGMRDTLASLRHIGVSNHHPAGWGRARDTLRLSLSQPYLFSTDAQLSKCCCRCVGASRLHLWSGYRGRRRTSASGEAPDLR